MNYTKKLEGPHFILSIHMQFVACDFELESNKYYFLLQLRTTSCFTLLFCLKRPTICATCHSISHSFVLTVFHCFLTAVSFISNFLTWL